VTDLRRLQLWFHELVTAEGEGLAAALAAAEAKAPLGRGEGGNVGRVLRSSASLPAERGVAIYRHAYRARLVECLVDDYPTLQHALGPEAFEGLAHDYLTQHPSRSPNLNGFGRHLPAFCRARPEPWAGFAADLAALEWALVEVLHAPSLSPLPAAELAGVPAERWPEVRFRASRGLRLLRFSYPVNAYLQAFRDELSPTLPEASPSATAVYRQGPRLWRQGLTPPMAEVLGALVEGRPLGEALARLERGGGADAAAGGADDGPGAEGADRMGRANGADEANGAAEEASRDVMHWFQAWVAAGFFAGLSLPEAESPAATA
jgi:hypothetical protein